MSTVYINSLQNGDAVLEFRYFPTLVALIKLVVPPKQRRYDPNTKRWLVADAAVDALVDMLLSQGYHVVDNRTAHARVAAQRGTLRINYLGNARMRGDGTVHATGMDEQGNWAYIFPYPALSAFFSLRSVAPSRITGTLYDVLGVGAEADAAALRRQYRAMVRQWHPDMGGTNEDFRAVQDAYELLSDDKKRRKYDLALKFSAGQQASNQVAIDALWVPPDTHRAGYWDCTYIESIGRYNVEQIHGFTPVVNSQGEHLFSTWTAANTVAYEWR